MSCPHALLGNPATCSQCLGAVPRVVAQAGPDIIIDGVAVRPVELEQWSPGVAQSRKRGGRRRKR